METDHDPPFGVSGEDERFIEESLGKIARQELSPMEIARTLLRVLEMPCYRQGSKTPNVKRVARRLGRSRTWTQRHLDLLGLHPEVRAMLESDAPPEERIGTNTGYALSLLRQEDQLAFLHRAREEGWVYRTLERRVRNHLLSQRPPGKISARTRMKYGLVHRRVMKLLAAADTALDLPDHGFVAALNGNERRQLLAQTERVAGHLADMKRALEA